MPVVQEYKITDIPTTATSPASDDYLEFGGSTNGSRRILAEDFTSSVITDLQVASLAALRAIAPNTSRPFIEVLGHTSAGDGGGGLFWYDSSSTAAEDYGVTVVPTDGSGRWVRQYSGPVNVKWFGAKGDASTDDITALTLAAAYAAGIATSDRHPRLYFPPGPGFKVGSGLSIGPYIDVDMDAPLLYSANSGTALTIGNAATANANVRLRLNARKLVLSTWVDSTVGIKLVNTYSSNVEIVEVAQFQDGLQCVGDIQGFVYNNVTLGAIRNNKVGLKLTTGAVTGWCNENNFFGGRFDISSGSNTSVSRNAIVITNANGTTYNNQNNFYKPSFELSYATRTGGATTIPVLLEYAEINGFFNVRYEDCGQVLASVTNASTRNFFDVGYGIAIAGLTISQTGTRRDTMFRSRNNYVPQGMDRVTVFESGPLAKIAAPYEDADSRVTIPRCHVGTSGNAFSYIAGSSIDIRDDHLGIATTRSVGVFVSTSVQKRFVVRRDFADTTKPGRVVLRAYDSAGAVLGAGNIFSVDGYGFTYYAGVYGGAYLSAEATADIFFCAGPNVDKVAVQVGAADAGYAEIKSFCIDSLDGGSVACWAGIDDGSLADHDNGVPLAWESPVKWANAIPGHLLNSSPDEDGVSGWVRTFRHATTVNGTEAGGQTVITVTDATGVTGGDIVTVLLDSGAYHHTTVNGAPAGNDITITDALPSAATDTGFWVARWSSYGVNGMVQGAAQADSVAAVLATLVTDFNTLLGNLRAAKVIAT